MKSVFITFDQAFFERIMALLDRQGCRGFSYWQQVQGRGSKTGEPHYGSHAWPSMCSAIITIVDEAKVDPLLDALHRMDEETQQLGLRAFVWNIEMVDFSSFGNRVYHCSPLAHVLTRKHLCSSKYHFQCIDADKRYSGNHLRS